MIWWDGLALPIRPVLVVKGWIGEVGDLSVILDSPLFGNPAAAKSRKFSDRIHLNPWPMERVKSGHNRPIHPMRDRPADGYHTFTEIGRFAIVETWSPSGPGTLPPFWWGVRLAAQDTALSRRRSGVQIPYALPVPPIATPSSPRLFAIFSVSTNCSILSRPVLVLRGLGW